MPSPELHVNVDHVATVRQARRTVEPNPIDAVKILDGTGVSGITTHLREDRRHIQDSDIYEIDEYLRNSKLGLTFEMGATDEIRAICLKTQSKLATLVPEKREEVTTEGGLDLSAQADYLREFIKPIQDNGTQISFFVDPIKEQIELAKDLGAEFVELHTGTYANVFLEEQDNKTRLVGEASYDLEALGNKTQEEIARLQGASAYAHSIGLNVNLGHGLTTANLVPLVDQCLDFAPIQELHIGHSLIANSIFYGITEAVGEYLALIDEHLQ